MWYLAFKVSCIFVLSVLQSGPPSSFAQVSERKKSPAKGYTEAQKWFRQAAAQGHKNAQYMLGLIFYNGRGVKKDYREARAWFERAAKQNHSGAQYMLGIIYYDGKGVPKDNGRASKWFTKTAKKGDKDAQYMLGLILYEHAKGTQKSSQK